VAVNSFAANRRKMISFLVVAAKRATHLEVIPDSRHTQLGLCKLLNVPCQESRQESRIQRQRIKQFSHPRTESKNVSSGCQMIQDSNRSRLDHWEALTYLQRGDPFALKSLAIDSEVGFP